MDPKYDHWSEAVVALVKLRYGPDRFLNLGDLKPDSLSLLLEDVVKAIDGHLPPRPWEAARVVELERKVARLEAELRQIGSRCPRCYSARKPKARVKR